MGRDEPHYRGHRERAKKKFLKEGLAPFADYEALELLLMYSIPRTDVKPAAKKLLKTFGSLAAVMDAPAEELEKVEGIGRETATLIRLVREINWRYMETGISRSEDYLSSPRAVTNFAKSRIGGEGDEFIMAIFVNTKNQYLEHEILSKGSVSSVGLNIRDVARKAIGVRKCSGVILVHNHPSGHTRPSESDKELTAELFKVCKSLDIRLVDHIVVSPHDHFSFIENGLLGAV